PTVLTLKCELVLRMINELSNDAWQYFNDKTIELNEQIYLLIILNYIQMNKFDNEYFQLSLEYKRLSMLIQVYPNILDYLLKYNCSDKDKLEILGQMIHGQHLIEGGQYYLKAIKQTHSTLITSGTLMDCVQKYFVEGKELVIKFYSFFSFKVIIYKKTIFIIAINSTHFLINSVRYYIYKL
ncbi:unnamed protein product, partial [Didymodactylos carnosus]